MNPQLWISSHRCTAVLCCRHVIMHITVYDHKSQPLLIQQWVVVSWMFDQRSCEFACVHTCLTLNIAIYSCIFVNVHICMFTRILLYWVLLKYAYGRHILDLESSIVISKYGGWKGTPSCRNILIWKNNNIYVARTHHRVSNVDGTFD